MRGIENIPAGNYILLANHLSWIAPFLLLVPLPAEPRVYFIAAEQAIIHRWKAWAIKLFDSAIPFERGSRWVGRDVFAKPLNVLRNGSILAFFPEGDSGTREGELMPLERGIGHFLASRLSDFAHCTERREGIVLAKRDHCDDWQAIPRERSGIKSPRGE